MLICYYGMFSPLMKYCFVTLCTHLLTVLLVRGQNKVFSVQKLEHLLPHQI